MFTIVGSCERGGEPGGGWREKGEHVLTESSSSLRSSSGVFFLRSSNFESGGQPIDDCVTFTVLHRDNSAPFLPEKTTGTIINLRQTLRPWPTG